MGISDYVGRMAYEVYYCKKSNKLDIREVRITKDNLSQLDLSIFTTRLEAELNIKRLYEESNV